MERRRFCEWLRLPLAGPLSYICDLWNVCEIFTIVFFYAGLSSRVSPPPKNPAAKVASGESPASKVAAFMIGSGRQGFTLLG
jgi:hypothetical protein